MTFNELCEIYKNQEEYVKRQEKYETNVEYLKGFLQGIYRAFRDAKCFIITPEDLVSRKPTEEERSKLIYIENGEVYEPCEILVYRGYNIPIYVDDYGQAMFTVVDGEQYTSGAYNLSYLGDISDWFDAKIAYQINS